MGPAYASARMQMSRAVSTPYTCLECIDDDEASSLEVSSKFSRERLWQTAAAAAAVSVLLSLGRSFVVFKYGTAVSSSYRLFLNFNGRPFSIAVDFAAGLFEQTNDGLKIDEK